jgi:hypothetical protein
VSLVEARCFDKQKDHDMIRRIDIVNLANQVAANFYAEVRAVGVDENSDEAAEGIVANAERANGGDLCTVGWWLEDATQIDRDALRELVVEYVAKAIRAAQAERKSPKPA